MRLGRGATWVAAAIGVLVTGLAPARASETGLPPVDLPPALVLAGSAAHQLQAELDPQPRTDKVVASDGRTYYLRHDPGLHGRVPLLVAMGGWRHTPSDVMRYTRLNKAADTYGFAVAYPAGQRDGSWNAAVCCGIATRLRVDDVANLRTLVRDVSSRVLVDRHRVYATGFSNGGMMSYRAVCEAPDVFAKAVVVAGALTTSCTAARVQVLHIHGEADTTVPYYGGTGADSARFLPVPGEPGRVGALSDVEIQDHPGGHEWPSWGTARLVDYLGLDHHRRLPVARVTDGGGRAAR